MKQLLLQGFLGIGLLVGCNLSAQALDGLPAFFTSFEELARTIYNSDQFRNINIAAYKNLIQRGTSEHYTYDTATAVAIAQGLLGGKTSDQILSSFLEGGAGPGAAAASRASALDGGFLSGTPDRQEASDRSRMDLNELFTNDREHLRPFRADGLRRDPEAAQPSAIKRGTLVMPGAHSAFSDLMRSKAVTDQTLDLLGSDQVVANATFMMTEPAVGAAWHNAAVLNRIAVLGEYMEDMHLMEQARLNPEAGQPMLRAYFSCVANKVAGDIPLGLSGDVQESTWGAAQAECMGDSIVTRATARNLDVAPSAERAFQAKDDPNWYSFTDLNGTAHGDNDTRAISLWSYLFPADELIDTSDYINPEDGSTLTAREWVDNMRAVFENLVGNLIFSFGQADGLPRRSYTVTKVPALMTSAQYINKSTENVYYKIIDLERDYCGYLNAHRPAITVPKAADSTTVNDYIRQIDEFWRNTYDGPAEITAQLRSLSFRGYWFKPDLGKDLYALIETRLGKISDCSVLDRSNATAFLYPLQGIAAGDEAAAAKFPSEGRLIFRLARQIADGQKLAQLLRATDFVNRTVNGTFDDALVRASALRLITDAGGVDNLQAAFNENLGTLQRGIGVLHGIAERNRKHQGLSIAGAMRSRSDAESPRAPDGLRS